MKSTLENDFIDYRGAFRREIIRLVNIMKLYRHLHEKKADRLEAMNQAPAFFTYVLDAFFTSIIVGTDKLLNDKRKSKEFTLFKYLNFIEQNIKLFSVEAFQKRKNYPDGHWCLQERESISLNKIKEDRRKIKDMKFLQSINLRRDKFHVHFDKKYFINPKKVKEDAPLIWNDLDEIEGTLTDIYNRYSVAFDGNFQEFKVLNLFEIDDILDILHEHKF